MLLQEWGGFTHIDEPMKGSIPNAAFAGRLESTALLARTVLAKRTAKEICKITDEVAWWFKEVWPEMDLEDSSLVRTHSQVCQLGSGLLGERFSGHEYHAAMSLMLVNEAVRLKGEAAAIAAIDAAEAAEFALNFRATERLKRRLHEQAERVVNEAIRKREQRIENEVEERLTRAAAEKQREQINDLLAARHRKNWEVRKYAIQLANEVRQQDSSCTAYAIVRKIQARVEKRARDITNELSVERSFKTIHGWLRQAEKSSLL